MTSRTAVSTVCVALGLLVVATTAQTPQVLQGQDLEQFLTRARITTVRDIGEGVTVPQRVTLELDGRTEHGVFKTIDEYAKVKQLNRSVELEFQDSWKTEVAAYELDKMLGVGMVPATVERAFGGRTGSLQFWITSRMSEAERVDKKLSPPRAFEWAEQVARVRMFDNLIYNTDRHLNNLRITDDWKIRLIDHSRSFRPFDELKNPRLLTRFSRSLLEKMDLLTEPLLQERVGRYLSPFQIQGLLKRRDAMVALSKKLVSERGAGAVLYR